MHQFLDAIKDKSAWIQTYSGKKFYPFNPDPNDIVIEDIAHALSMTCRYAGHTKWFYSVAEHSIHLCNHVNNVGEAGQEKLWALLHDATEAYLPDIPRPIKKYIPGFKQVEDNLMSVIAFKFGLRGAMPPEIKGYDTRILVDESRILLGTPPEPWTHYGPPINVHIKCYEPTVAEREFLRLFHYHADCS